MFPGIYTTPPTSFPRQWGRGFGDRYRAALSLVLSLPTFLALLVRDLYRMWVRATLIFVSVKYVGKLLRMIHLAILVADSYKYKACGRNAVNIFGVHTKYGM